jgi:hypothetical protein
MLATNEEAQTSFPPSETPRLSYNKGVLFTQYNYINSAIAYDKHCFRNNVATLDTLLFLLMATDSVQSALQCNKYLTETKCWLVTTSQHLV